MAEKYVDYFIIGTASIDSYGTHHGYGIEYESIQAAVTAVHES